VDLIVHGIKLAADDVDGEAPELIFHRAGFEVAMIAGGEVDGEGRAQLEGFYFTFTERDETGELVPGSVVVKIPVQAEAARLFCSSVLDALDQAREPAKHAVSVAGAPELAALEHGRANREQRRRRQRG
jgi:hypothetical protein